MDKSEIKRRTQIAQQKPVDQPGWDGWLFTKFESCDLQFSKDGHTINVYARQPNICIALPAGEKTATNFSDIDDARDFCENFEKDS